MNNTMLKLPKMSLDEARAVIWPFREIKGRAFGPLFDSGLLSLQDLRYAVLRAYDPQVREAARVILLHELFQEPLEPDANAPGPLNVVSVERRSFAERRQMQIAMIEGAILGGLIATLFYLLWSMFNRPHNADENESLSTILSSPTGVAALIFVLVLFFLAVYVFPRIVDRLILSRLDKQMKLYRKGQLGEERVLNVMYGVLDGKWWLFRNLELPGRRIGDLDLILVGPYGAWSFEVKAYSGDYRNAGDRWERRANNRWYPIGRKGPTYQARRNAGELSRFLSTNQIKQWITPVIVWANPESTVRLENPSTPVWTLDELSDRLKELEDKRPIGEEQVQRIVGVLQKISREDDPEV